MRPTFKKLGNTVGLSRFFFLRVSPQRKAATPDYRVGNELIPTKEKR